MTAPARVILLFVEEELKAIQGAPGALLHLSVVCDVLNESLMRGFESPHCRTLSYKLY
jgi:hypothetical protein